MLGVGWLIGGAVVGGLISAFSNGYQAYNSAKAQNEQIDYQKQQLEKQKDQLTTQYNNSVKWTNYQFGQSMSQGNDTISRTTNNRDLSAIANAESMYAQNKNELQQLNNTIANYTAQKGQLDSYVASSGFRNTEDTTGKQINKARGNIDNAIYSAIDTVNLNANQRFLQSRMSYLESSKDIESYQNALLQVQAQTQHSLKTMKEEYDYKNQSIIDQINYLNSNRYSDFDIGTMTALSGASGLLSGGSAGANLMSLFGK